MGGPGPGILHVRGRPWESRPGRPHPVVPSAWTPAWGSGHIPKDANKPPGRNIVPGPVSSEDNLTSAGKDVT